MQNFSPALPSHSDLEPETLPLHPEAQVPAKAGFMVSLYGWGGTNSSLLAQSPTEECAGAAVTKRQTTQL